MQFHSWLHLTKKHITDSHLHKNALETWKEPLFAMQQKWWKLRDSSAPMFWPLLINLVQLIVFKATDFLPMHTLWIYNHAIHFKLHKKIKTKLGEEPLFETTMSQIKDSNALLWNFVHDHTHLQAQNILTSAQKYTWNLKTITVWNNNAEHQGTQVWLVSDLLSSLCPHCWHSCPWSFSVLNCFSSYSSWFFLLVLLSTNIIVTCLLKAVRMPPSEDLSMLFASSTMIKYGQEGMIATFFLRCYISFWVCWNGKCSNQTNCTWVVLIIHYSFMSLKNY